MIVESHGPEETFALGQTFGQKAEAGSVYCLEGDLGTGKTVFTQGFAKGLGITGPVNSPTFTIMQVYEDGRLPLYHFDAYRIAFGKEEFDHLCVLCLERFVLVMYDAIEVLGEGIGSNGDESVRSGLH